MNQGVELYFVIVFLKGACFSKTELKTLVNNLKLVKDKGLIEGHIERLGH